MKTINLSEAAALTGYSRNTVRKWLDAGLLPYRVEPLSGFRRICPDDLRRFIESWRVENPSKAAEPSNVKQDH